MHQSTLMDDGCAASWEAEVHEVDEDETAALLGGRKVDEGCAADWWYDLGWWYDGCAAG